MTAGQPRQIENPYIATTDGVRVSAQSKFLSADSNISRQVFVFSYTISIHNIAQLSIKLLERYWIIKSNGQPVTEIVGPGVVGEQPVIEPGDKYEYSSGAVISDPIGSMYGSYTFRAENGKFLNVKIPEFDLVCPIALH